MHGYACAAASQRRVSRPPTRAQYSCALVRVSRAQLRRMYAIRSRRANKAREAVALLTEALQEASGLKVRGVHLMQGLLETRADVHESLQDAESASADRARAAKLRAMRVETLAPASPA